MKKFIVITRKIGYKKMAAGPKYHKQKIIVKKIIMLIYWFNIIHIAFSYIQAKNCVVNFPG